MENTVQIPPVLIGRHDECATLKGCLASNRSEFVIVCGRRRIGKTFLVDQFFENRYDFSFVGKHKTKTQTQLNYFAKAIQKYSGQKQKTYADWYDAFDALEYYLETLPVNRKKIIFIDEMPWIDTQRSTFVSALENFWNGWANRRYDIVLIASGSAPSGSPAQITTCCFFIRAHRCAGNMTNYTAHCLLMWIPISRLLKFCTTINTA